MVERENLTLEEWEAVFGRQVRTARVARASTRCIWPRWPTCRWPRCRTWSGARVDPQDAHRRGPALGRTDWLESFAPEVTVSPMQMLRAKQRAPRRR